MTLFVEVPTLRRWYSLLPLFTTFHRPFSLTDDRHVSEDHKEDITSHSAVVELVTVTRLERVLFYLRSKHENFPAICKLCL